MQNHSRLPSIIEGSYDEFEKGAEVVEISDFDVEAEPLMHGSFASPSHPQSPSNPLNVASQILFKAFRVISAKFHHISHRPSISTTPATANNSTSSRSSNSPVVRSYDGLRGLACLFVFNFHFFYPYTRVIFHSYGATTEGVTTTHLYQLPFLALPVRGHAMVSLFFTISGYVLSNGYLSATLQDPSSPSSHSRLSSLVLRRWMRLYLPGTCSTFMVMLASYLGLFERGRLLINSEWMQGKGEEHPPMLPTFSEQIQHYGAEWWTWASPWTWDWHFSEYDPHTWTIPFEFRDSLVVFLLLLALTRVKFAWRIVISLICASYALSCGHWDVATFIFGVVAAMFHSSFSHAISSQPSLPSNISPKKSTRLFLALKITLLLVGLYLLSFPDDDPHLTPGYRTLEALTPATYHYKVYFWIAIGAPLVIWSVELLDPVRRLLELSIPQYLGRISFAFYLVHGPLLHAVGFSIQPVIWRILGANSQEMSASWLLGALAGYLIMLTLAISFGHLFYVFVDKKLVAFARRVEKFISIDVK